MADYYYRASRGDGTTLFIAPLADRVIDAAGQDLPTSGGHFLFERRDDDPTEVRVIAHLVSDEAVFEMKQLLRLEWA
jgi:hypothetical protein